MGALRFRIAAVAVAILLIAGAAALVRRAQSGAGRPVRVSVGELQTVHAEVRIGEREVRGIARFSVGDHLVTGKDGRARIRLDDGTTVVVDRATELGVTERGLDVRAGRIYVRGGGGARTEISAGAAATVVSASGLGFERTPDATRLYCADGEAVIRAGAHQGRIRSGETAVWEQGRLSVAPEKAFNDWTGGMATSWSAAGRPRASVGELWGRTPSAPDEGGLPLVIRSHDVQARMDGEVAMTLLETTFFNAGSAMLDGDFRMAVPRGAIVSRFALRRGAVTTEGVLLAGTEGDDRSTPRLEWAGPDWVRGFVPGIPAGETVSVIVEYREWLSVTAGHMTYRHPMVSESPAARIGELRARIDVSGAKPRGITVGRGARVLGDLVELRGADLVPEADLVVELDVEQPAADRARAYVARPGNRDPKGDSYFLVRAEVPAEAAGRGVTLALVLDTSYSMSPSQLDSGRAVIESIVEGLGSEDRLAIFAADQQVRPVGRQGFLPVDEPRRQEIREALATLRPGGAGDLGLALEHAADALPSDAPGATVVYVGDGWPTLGDTDADAVRARLARRPQGVPRLSAVAIGSFANHYLLATLVRGAGPVVEVIDRLDAAQAAVTLLAGALEPIVSGVELDLGPTVDRVYPRGAQTLPANGSVMVVGRLRGDPPTSVVVRYHRDGRTVEEQRPIDRRVLSKSGDIRRRWARARLDDVIVRGESVEPALEIAQRAKLLTPWTGFYVTSGGPVVATPFAERLLDSTAMATLTRPGLAEAAGETAALLELPLDAPANDADDFQTLVVASARRTLAAAIPGVRRCRDTRAALRPDLSGTLQVRVVVEGSGRVSRVGVRAARAGDDDPALNRCVEKLIASLPFFDSGTDTSITVDHEIVLPPPRDHVARRCSPTSKLPLALRKSVWRERGLAVRFPADRDKLVELYVRARRACEIPAWADQRELLEMMIEKVALGPSLVDLAAKLDEADEAEAAQHLRRAAVRHARTPEALVAVRMAILGEEPAPGRVFEKQFRDARGDEARLSVVRRFLRMSAHDELLRRLQFLLLERLGRKDVLVQAIYDVRQDPFASAALLADGASALRRIGREDEGRRAFGELVERAPSDPFARAYVGDRLRDEGLFEDATAAYEALDRLMPGDAAVALRLALAHAGAGRLDVATRVLDRVAQTGGRAADIGLGELASMTSAVLLAGARERAGADEAHRIEQRAFEVPLPDVAGVVLLRTPVLDAPLEARLIRTAEDGSEATPDLAAPSMGLFGMRLERGDGPVRIKVRRPPRLDPGRAVPVRVDVLSLDESRPGKLVHKELLLPADGKDAELTWDGGTLL